MKFHLSAMSTVAAYSHPGTSPRTYVRASGRRRSKTDPPSLRASARRGRSVEGEFDSAARQNASAIKRNNQWLTLLRIENRNLSMQPAVLDGDHALQTEFAGSLDLPYTA
jgi:hypothetical protein